MKHSLFHSESGTPIPAVTAEEMREVDRLAVERFQLGILQMMENAGRNLAQSTLSLLDGNQGEVAILTGSGGNGGGGVCCARHLHNRGVKTHLILTKDLKEMKGSVRAQLEILLKTGARPIEPAQAQEAIKRSSVIVDSLIGYSLIGEPRGRTAELIDLCNQHAQYVISLDLPSGMDATTGEVPGMIIQSQRTLTLALPKTGLARYGGDLYLADIGIPPEVYYPIGLEFEPFFGQRYSIPLVVTENG